MKETPKTIRFRRYAPLKLTKRTAKKTISKKEIKKVTDLLAKNVAKSIDDEVIGILKAGSAKKYIGLDETIVFGNNAYGATRPMKFSWSRLWLNVRYDFMRARIRIAEWVGGDDLHSNCGDY